MKRARTHPVSRLVPAPDAAPAPPRESHDEPIPGRDYTPEIIEFLKSVHGDIRRDSRGDYFYGTVSTISLHFLLHSRIPRKELLWCWYQHFDRRHAETIYQTLPPLADGTFLEILGACAFAWDAERVKESGLVFLAEHRAEIYLAIEEALDLRLDAYRTLGEFELRATLTPYDTWTDPHLRRLIHRVQCQPLSYGQRQAIYGLFDSDYVRATARHMMDAIATETFWKKPPPELEALEGRLIAFARTMREEARRLGVYVSRDAFEARGAAAQRASGRPHPGWAGAAAEPPGTRQRAASHFATLGLRPGATLNDVKMAYREKVKQHHPDQGGTVQDFLRLQEAYEFLLVHVY